MIPLKDDLPTERMPLVTIAIIAINVVVFLVGWFHHVPTSDGPVRTNDLWALEYGLFPCELIHDCKGRHDVPIVYQRPNHDGHAGEVVKVPDRPAILTILTSTFLHGGWAHLIFNMLFFWIFGNNVEDSMSRPRFALFYLLGAVISALGQALPDLHSVVPQIGASGAIAACIGAYLVLYPRVHILTLVMLPLFGFLVRVPALIIAGLWGVGQFVSSMQSLYGPSTGGGVAYMAHLTGFLGGALLIKLFCRPKESYARLYEEHRRYV